MAQCYVAPITRIPEKDVFLAKVPAGKTLHAGDIIDLSELDTGIANNTKRTIKMSTFLIIVLKSPVQPESTTETTVWTKQA